MWKSCRDLRTTFAIDSSSSNANIYFRQWQKRIKIWQCKNRCKVQILAIFIDSGKLISSYPWCENDTESQVKLSLLIPEAHVFTFSEASEIDLELLLITLWKPKKYFSLLKSSRKDRVIRLSAWLFRCFFN